MAVSFVIAVTDGDWFEFLKNRPDLDEINFWSPGSAPFRALSPGELFLFKLHAPQNYIVGGGIFAHASTMRCSLAWEAFGEKNGADSFQAMRTRIARYRNEEPTTNEDFEIGCRILTQPFFLDQVEWITPPNSWSPNIVSYKGYSTGDDEGMALWNAVQIRTQFAQVPRQLHEGERYGDPMLVRPRLGQGAFRIVVTDSYHRKCAVTGERTLPALDAAHIKPFSEGGSHDVSNGLLLRRDIHALFDRGYVTVTPDLRFEVSRRIHDDFDNGKNYYEMRGTHISTPDLSSERADPKQLRWHNENCFLG